MYIDTHCHLDDEKFTDVAYTIEQFRKENVTKAITMGCDIQTSITAKTLAKKFDEVYFGVGFHPGNLQEYCSEKLDVVSQLSKDDKCVCIGEIGLDYHYEERDKDKQIKAFIEQIELANSLNLPVSIHSRDATQDTIETLKKNPAKFGGVIHCYSGSIESAEIYVKMGYKIGFGGTVTFKNAKNIQQVATEIDESAILTETDSPYLAPEPFRGTLNSPKNIPQIVSKIAILRGKSPEYIAKLVKGNASNLFSKIK